MAAVSPTVASGVAAPWSERTWLRATREPRTPRRFRAAAGVVLAFQFAKHIVETAPLLAAGSLYEPNLLRDLPTHGAQLADALSAPALRALFCIPVLLALAIAFDVWPRLCAAGVGLVAVATYWVLWPAAYVDDSAAIGLALWTLLLPVAARDQPGASVPALAVNALLVQVLLGDFAGAVGPLSGLAGDPLRWSTMALRAAAVLLLCPNGLLVLLGMGIQIGVHGYLAWTTPAHVFNLALGAGSLLFWGDAPPAGARRRPIDAGAVGAVAAVWLAACVVVYQIGLRRGPFEAAARVFGDLGLSPPNGVPTPDLPHVPLQVQSRADGRGSNPRVYDIVAAGVRAQLLATHLSRSGDPAREAIAAALAAAHCKATLGPSENTLSYGDAPPLFAFLCDEAGNATPWRPRAPTSLTVDP